MRPHAREFFARRFKKIARLGSRITLLRIEPARQRLAIVVINDAGERLDFAVDGDAVAMTYIIITRSVLAVAARRAAGRACPARPAVNTVDEFRPIAASASGARRPASSSTKCIAELVIGIERQHPWRCRPATGRNCIGWRNR